MAVVVAAGVQIAWIHCSDSSYSADQSPRVSTALTADCNHTLYAEACVSSLDPNATSNDPVQLFHLAVEVTVAELTRASLALERFAAIDNSTRAAVASCQELFGLSVTCLNDCLALGNDPGEVVDDVRTWLSAAVTYQDTCIDGFANSSVELQAEVAAILKNSTEYTRNSLAIFIFVANLIGEFMPHGGC